MGSLWLLASRNPPTEHAVHALAAVAESMNRVPAPHAAWTLHAPAPSVSTNVPLAHLVHLPEPALAYKPLPHFLHSVPASYLPPIAQMPR